MASRRGLAVFVGAVGAIGLLSARPAAAQIYDRAERNRGLSQAANDFVFELRFGPYIPRVDSEFANATPYRDTFGDKTRYLLGLEFDWQALKLPGVGSLGPGLGWGATESSAPAPITGGGGKRGAQVTNLWIMPMYAVAVARLDALMAAKIPIQPYVKAGIGVGLWWTNDSIKTSEVNGVTGQGTSIGYQLAAGAVLNLSFLDPEAGSTDSSSGIGAAGLFGELYHSNLNGFGAGNQMQVGTNTWFAGLNVAF